MRAFSSLNAILLAAALLTARDLPSAEGDGTLGPWRKGDIAESAARADDAPDPVAVQTVARHYRPLLPERIFPGEKGKLKFRVMPRAPGWAGLLVLDLSGKPVPISANMNRVFLFGPDGRHAHPAGWIQHDTQFLYSDASPVAMPKTRISVYAGPLPKPRDPPATPSGEPIDTVVVDFANWSFSPSTVQLSQLLDGATRSHGPVIARNGAFWREGKRMFFWGGHENHVPSKDLSDRYAEAYSAAGLNLQRSIAFEEIVADPATGALDPAQLDRYHYLIAKLGERGIYFFMSGSGLGYLDGLWGFARGKEPPEIKRDPSAWFWLEPRCREAWKRALRTAFAAPNPYAGGVPLKDDPTLLGFELANERGLNERRFDFNRIGVAATERWREAFNGFLLRKYGSRDKLAKAWETHPLFPHEDPARNTILIPTNYRGARSPYGGRGQHDQFLTPRWYRNDFRYGLPPRANPRVLDAIEFNRKVAKRSYPFDFNHLAAPEEMARLREAFNDFLMEKYGSREALGKAWIEDPLFPWETPSVGIHPKTKKPDPALPRKTILIPSNYRGQTVYEEDDHRLADPRVSDAMEFTYEVQKTWATDMARFLRDEIGLKCAIGWNGDTFHVVQPPNHQANMNSPLDVTIAAPYLDQDNGEQLTSRIKNLKRFTAYGRIHGRPMFAYEWSVWRTQGPYVYEYALLAGILGRLYGFDAFAHHKMAPIQYPVSDPEYSRRIHYITPISDRLRRGAFCLMQWILQRARIAEEDRRILIGMPDQDAFLGGPERKMSNWAFENWLMYQIGTEDYAFQDVYDGPADRVVVHSGHGPYGDYRRAKHAILWCNSHSGREGKNPKAKEAWFALHGIRFATGQKYFLNDQFFATTEDLTDYNVVHAASEQARDAEITERARTPALAGSTARSWAATGVPKPTETDRQIYAALKRWGYPLPFAEEEIDVVWRSRDRSMEMDTRKECFRAVRDDFVLWFGRAGPDTRLALGPLAVATDEKQYAAALLPWDTADFATASTLLLWTLWNSEVFVKTSFAKEARIYAVNWLGQRLFEVRPTARETEAVRFLTARHEDIFGYEITRAPPAP